MAKRKNIRYKDAKQTGVCMIVSCYNPVYKPGVVWCEGHNESYRTTEWGRARQLREQGLCTRKSCGNPLAASSRDYCEKHLKERTEQQQRRRKARRLEAERSRYSKKDIKELRKNNTIN